MKNTKSFILGFALFMVLLSLPVAVYAKAAFTKERVIVYEGQKRALQVKGLSGKVTYQTSDEAVATVSKTGRVKGIKAGEAVITAANGKKSVSCQVQVREIHMHRDTRTVKVGGEFKMKLKCGAKEGITFTVSNEKVIIFLRQEGNLGYFQGLKAGKATVKASYKGKTYKCKVTVKAAEPSDAPEVTPSPEPTPTVPAPSGLNTSETYWEEDVELPMTRKK